MTRATLTLLDSCIYCARQLCSSGQLYGIAQLGHDGTATSFLTTLQCATPGTNPSAVPSQALFVSNDRIYDDYAATFTQILWPAIPFEKTARRRAALASRFDVPEGAFRLIVVSGAGKVLNPDAMAAITAQNNFEGYPWESNPEPLPTMTSRAVQCLDTVSGCTIS